MCMHVKAEDSLQILVLSFCHVGPGDHCAWQQTPLPAEPSCWPQFFASFVVLCFCSVIAAFLLLFSSFIWKINQASVCALYFSSTLWFISLLVADWVVSILGPQLLSYSISCRDGFFVERRNALDNMLLNVVSPPTHFVSWVLLSPPISWDHIVS